MHFGRYASRKSEAKYPSLWDGLACSLCPAIQNPSGNTLFDLTGRAQHGEMINFSMPSAWERKSGRNCITTDGVDDRVVLSNPASVNVATNYTLSIWFTLNASQQGILVTNRASLTNIPWLLYRDTDDRIRFLTNSGGTDNFQWVTDILTINRLYHLCVIKTSGRVASYVDGRLFLDVSMPDGAPAVTPLATIGAMFVSGYSFFGRFSVFDFAFYTRPISVPEVRTLSVFPGSLYEPKKKTLTLQVGSSANRLRSSRFAAFPA